MALNTYSLSLTRASSMYASIINADAALNPGTGALYTVEAWVYVTNVTLGNVAVSNVTADSVGACFKIQVTTGAKANLNTWASTGGFLDVTGATSLVNNTWAHIAGVKRSDSSWEVYLNGVSDATSASTRALTVTIQTGLRIGANDGSPGSNTPNSGFFGGLIDEARLWSTARTTAQILTNKNVQLVGNESGLVAYYQLNNNYEDQTANNYDLTATNSPTFSTTIPFSGNITFDATANGTVNPATSLTFSHTCAGSNRILFVSLINNSAPIVITGVTYSGVAMTLLDSRADAGTNVGELWYLLAPATGANNVVISADGSCAITGASASYNGVRQSAPAVYGNNRADSATTVSKALTSTIDNSWLVAGTTNNFAATSWTAGANTVFRSAAQCAGFCELNFETQTAGSNTLTANLGSSASLMMFAAFIAPPAAGPANLKTFNGLATASIKTINGLAIGSIKSVNGLT